MLFLLDQGGLAFMSEDADGSGSNLDRVVGLAAVSIALLSCAGPDRVAG